MNDDSSTPDDDQTPIVDRSPDVPEPEPLDADVEDVSDLFRGDEVHTPVSEAESQAP